MHNKVIVITGGATGIGYALIQELYQQNTVISLDRNAMKIERLQKDIESVITIQTDITVEGQVDAALRVISEKYGRIDLLLNNAGAGKIIDFLNSTPAYLKEILENEIATNYLAPVLLTRKALPLLENSTNPMVVFITSGLAYTPIAGFAGYCASKSAMHSFAQSLRHQLRYSKIEIIEVLPPTVDTDFNKDIDAPKISPQKFATAFLGKLFTANKTINIGQSATLNLFSRYFPSLAFKTLNR